MSFCGEHDTDGECSECVAEYYYDKINHLERQLAEARELLSMCLVQGDWDESMEALIEEELKEYER